MRWQPDRKCEPTPVPGALIIEFYDNTSYEEVKSLLQSFEISTKDIERETFMNVTVKANFVSETNIGTDFERVVSEIERDERVERTIGNASISNELTVVFKPQAKVTRRETDLFLESLGFKVIDFMRDNFAGINVPIGKEEQFTNTFRANSMVKSVSNDMYLCLDFN
jgi:hypothetical protein